MSNAPSPTLVTAAANSCCTTGDVCPADADRYGQEGVTPFCGIVPV